ncbi:benzoate transporter [Thauera terpenica 58Eu]|uniref:Beta-monoglucosyldiacylglycerol synthase n=1 Tax=Thauera terpenica 58Eu TaxID=1348657 RepID=T0AYN5_9RHOO|nr:glycosyltransferase [Thauera terpenica]EPZ15693.1 benzoate transporter [Thauera terpenica 58Eu]MBP6761438.1 glycosyltransferase [Thauera sp.]
MKQAATLIYRLAIALAIAAGVAFIQYWIWQQFNHGAEFISTNQSIKGFAYNGFQRDQSPLKQSYPTREQLAGDLDLLARISDGLRTYGMTDMPELLDLAGEREMNVTAGAWLDPDVEKNEREITAVIDAARKMRHVERLMVGNEAILRGDLKPDELIVYLDRVRKAVRKPVSSAEPWHVWLRYPELAQHVDYITVHLLPYHEGVPVEAAVDYAFQRYDELVKAFPRKKIVVGEIGWPSKGPTLGAAVPSLDNEARFIREFLSNPRTARIDYFLMEAIDQPWKVDVEGWAGPYWGMYNADREQKFALEGIIERDPHWSKKAINAAALAFLPMLLMAFFLSDWSVSGRVFLAGLIQACVSTLIVGLNVPVDYYLTQRDLVGLGLLIGATMLTAAVLLSHGFEFGEMLFKKKWRRRFLPLPPHAAEQQPFVSVHLACYNEPPEMVIATIDSLAKMNYQNFEVLILDNNTRDEALWKPLEKRCAELGPRFRFFHLANWPGFKAGALNYGLKVTDPRAEVVGVVDADYVVDPEWLSGLIPHFDKADVAVVQAPQAHRDWERQPFKRMCNWEFDGFFRIGMHHRNERNALIQHGTMTLVRRLALEEVGGWSEWCICEDTELGLRLIEKGYDTRYVDHILGRGLTPSGFAAIKSQRFRWAFGAMQILKAHLPQMIGRSNLNLAQRYHFLTGWFAWLGDALQLVFAFGSLAWTLGILLFPKAFGLPVTALALPILGFMAFKAALGPILYRRTMDCPWKDILGASILSVGLAHAIARGVFAGLVKKKGVFVVTPKGWHSGGALAFFNPIREEVGMLIALLMGAITLVAQRGADNLETQLWVGILCLQCIPYVAAILCQVAAYMPERPEALGSEEALPVSA